MKKQAPLSLKYRFEKAPVPIRPLSNPIDRFGNLATQFVQYAPSIIPFLTLGRAEKIADGLLDPLLIARQPKVESLPDQVRIRRIEDLSGPLVEYNYDAKGYINEVILLGSLREKYSWSDQGYLLSVVTNNSDLTQFRYCDDGLLSSISYPNGSIFKYYYDEVKRLSAIRYPDAISTKYTLDNKGQLIRAEIANKAFEYIWDESGSLQEIKFHCRYGTWGYKANETRQKLRIKFHHHTTGNARPVSSALGSWNYDHQGELLEMFVPSGERSVKRSSDDRLELASWQNKGQTDYRFDKQGILMGITNSIGSKTAIKRLISEKTVILVSALGISVLAYDEMGRLKADRDHYGRGASYRFSSHVELKSITTQGMSVSVTWMENKFLKKIYSGKKFSASIRNVGNFPDCASIISNSFTNAEMIDWLVKFLWHLQAMKQIRRLTDIKITGMGSCL